MKASICAGLIAVTLLAPTLAGAQSQPQPVAKITAEQAKKIALERIPGKATDVTIEKKGGKNVYVVEIQTPNGEKDVFVDLETGKIVGTD